MNELLERRAALKAKLLALVAKANAEQDGAFTDEQKAEADAWVKEGVEINAKLQKRAADDELRKAISELGGELNAPSEQGQQAAGAPGRRKSIGEQFTGADAYKSWISQIAPGGHINEKAHVNGPAIPVDMKSLITGLSDTSGGALIVNDRFPDIVAALRRPLMLRSVVATGTISVDAIDWVKVNVETNNAAIVAEATSQSDGTKPESTFTFTKTTETVKTVAHWLAASKRSLSDASQLQTLIDNFLEDGLNQALEDQMVTGNGVGDNMVGLFNISGIQTQAFTTDLLQTYRRAKTIVRTVGRDVPNAYLMNPVDWQNVDLLKDNENRYYFGGPRDVGNPFLWGLPVIESEAVTAGTAFVGNFKQLVLLDREQATMQVSDSHSDFFIKNLVAILAELRAMFLCRRPKSIVKIALS